MSTGKAQNILSNVGFELGSIGWSTYVNTANGYAASINTVSSTKHSGNSCMKVQITQIPNSLSYGVALKNNNLEVKSGRSYQASIWLKASNNIDARLTFRKNSSPYTEYESTTIQLNTDWEMYQLVLDGCPVSTSSDMRFAIELGTSTGTVYIDDAIITDCSRSNGMHSLQGSVIGKGEIAISNNFSTQYILESGNTNYATGENITLTATASPGYSFTKWGGACSGTATCNVTISNNTAVSAYFTKTSNVDVCIDPLNSVDWSLAGHESAIPFIEDNVINMTQAPYNCIGNNSTNNYTKIQQALNDAANNSGWTVLYFPAGSYKIQGNSPLVISDSTIIRGECQSSTKFNLNFSGYNGKKGCFYAKYSGSHGSNRDILNGSMLKSNQLTLSSTSGIQVGDFIELSQDNDPNLMYFAPGWPGQSVSDVSAAGNSWASRAVGEIARITQISGQSVWLDRNLHHSYRQELNPKAKPIKMVKNVGFENFKIERIDSDSSYNIFMKYAYNSWVRNIYSFYAVKGHVSLENAYHCEIRDSYFYNAHRYGSTGMAYGADMKFRSTLNLVENNIFRKLRHSMIVSIGCNGNVYGYNYSRESHDQLGAGVNTKCDISIHGFYPFMNLFEGNIVQYIYSGDWNGASGPGNTFFRNRVYDKPLKVKNGSHRQNIIGNELTNWALGGPGLNSNIEIASNCNNTNQHSNNDRGNIDNNLFHTLPISLYRSNSNNLYGFQIPSIGPYYPIEEHINLAYHNYLNNTYVDCLPNCNLNINQMDSIYKTCHNTISITGPSYPIKRVLHGIKINSIPNNYGGGLEGNPELYYKIKNGNTTIFTSTIASSSMPPIYLSCNYIELNSNATYNIEIWDDDSPLNDDHLSTLSMLGSSNANSLNGNNTSLSLTKTNYSTNYYWSTGSTNSYESISQAGNYSLQIETPEGCEAKHDFLVEFAQKPTITLHPWGPQVLCPNSPPGILNINVNGGFNVQYQWYWNNTNSNINGTPINGANSSSFVPPTNIYGTKYYYCVVSDFTSGCGSDTSSTTSVTIQDGPLITTQPFSSQTICQNTPVAILQTFATGPTPLDYQWYSTDSANGINPTQIAGETDSIFIPPNDSIGTFYYYCVAKQKGFGNCVSVTSHTCTVNVISQPTILQQGIDSQAICINAMPNPLNIELSQVGQHIEYEWFHNGNSIAGAHDSTYLPSPNPGINKYSCNITVNGGGCYSLNSDSFIVNAIEGAKLLNPQNMSQLNLCQGDSVYPMILESQGGNLQWYSNDSASFTGASLISGAVTDTLYWPDSIKHGQYHYFCIAQDTSIHNCGNDTMFVFKISWNPSPLADFNYSDSLLHFQFNNLSQNATSFLWFFGDGDSSNTQNPSHSYDSIGTYQITLIAYNQCSTDTLTDILNISISDVRKLEGFDFQCYPNPVTSHQNINIMLPKIEGRLSIYNIEGKLIWCEQITQSKYCINTDKWSAGSYYIEWVENNKCHKQKLKLL